MDVKRRNKCSEAIAFFVSEEKVHLQQFQLWKNKMASFIPIYSQVVPKSQQMRGKSSKPSTNRNVNLPRGDFDPLNYNNGGNFVTEQKDKKEVKRREERKRSGNRESEGKVEAYLRQYQVSIRQQQHRHSAVRQAEHRVNLRSLPLNEAALTRHHDRTPTDRHKPFPEKEKDGAREHRRERDKDRDKDNLDQDGNPLSITGHGGGREGARAVRKSASAQRVADAAAASASGIGADKRRFFCREWAFQKIAHCLEQRPNTKTCGALVLGDAGSGKTALCQELSEPGQGPQARQQRALNRRLLARHFLQGNTEVSLRPGEFVRSLAMQILSHSSKRPRPEGPLRDESPHHHDSRDCEEERLVARFSGLGDDAEESSKPLLADSEDPRTDEEEAGAGEGEGGGGGEGQAPGGSPRPARTIDRLHERANYVDSIRDTADDLPQILPRQAAKATNPFVGDEKESEFRLYENHENLFLRNMSQPQPQPRERAATARLLRQSSEPADARRACVLHKSHSADHKNDRIPVANFRYPNKSDLRSAENSPKKTEASASPKEEVEYQNILSEKLEEKLMEVKEREEVPPPIPSLPVSARALVADAYYEKLMAEQEIQQALLPHNLEKNPDECFKKALLFPLLEIDPPKQCLFLLVDAIDEGAPMGGSCERESGEGGSASVAQLLARHHHLLPQWLLLVCTARRHSRHLTKMFTGFRKITLDELQRAHVSADVQRYVLARLDCEPRLRARVSSDAAAAAAAAAALDHLRIKSDGCLLYLEKVLDGVADGFIALREVKEIPGTLNGLYLWLAQRLFHGRRFTKVRLLLDVMLAARCGVREEMLYKCLLTKECSVTREDFNRRMHLLRRIVVLERESGQLSLFHHSFARWLLDVKHCTRRYLCCPADGHAALAMYYTLDAKRLTPLEIHNYVFHMTQLEQHLASQKKHKGECAEQPLDLHTLMLLWVLDSSCDVESALAKDPDAYHRIAYTNHTLVAGAGARWSRDARVLRTLLELAAERAGAPRDERLHALLSSEEVVEDDLTESIIENEEEGVEVDPSAVFELVSKGDDETLAAVLKRHPHLVGACDASGGTALHAAARAGRAACASALLRAGAPPDAADADGWSPLRAAAWAGHTEVVEVLLESGCDVDCVDGDSRTALRAAAWSGHGAVVARLLAAGARADLADAEGRTPLIAAAYMGHAGIVRALLDAGAGIDHADEDGRTALSVAALCGSGAACAALLLERGADAARADRDGATPLLVAAFEGHADICELLLEAEADAEAADAAGRTALWAAAAAGHAPTVQLLLFWGACVDAMDPEGRTVLTTAAAQGNVEVVRQLLDRGLDEHHRDNSGWTPLHYAAFEGHIEVCEALLEAGAKVDEADNDGKGALMLAAQEGHRALVEVLVDEWAAPGHFDVVQALHLRGADVDAVDADRRSTLYVLALDNRMAMARFLIEECGAKVDTTDNEGRTPLHVSAWQGHTDMVNLLIKVGGARVDGRDRCLRTALHAAAWRGRTAALRALLAHGATPGAVCTQGATPLGIAAQEGHEECVVWLLHHGADPMQPDHCGRTPGKVAWRAGHANICWLLERWGSAEPTAPPPTEPPVPGSVANGSGARPTSAGSPEYKRRSVPSSNSTKSSSNMTSGSARHRDPSDATATATTAPRAQPPLSFAQQVARCGRGRRGRGEPDAPIPEHHVLENDTKLRSYLANERDLDLRGYACERDRRREERHGGAGGAGGEGGAGDASPLYASPPRSPLSDICSPTQPNITFGSQPVQPVQPVLTDTHFNRDTHMRIILGRDSKPQQERPDAGVWRTKGRVAYNKIVGSIGRARGGIFKKTKNKRNGIVTNPAMRLVANVRSGLDSAAANIRRTGVALAASASHHSHNPAVRSNAFHWRKETPL
ncbi:hypothetical protein K1T71_000845 [Dendrolimus kikuchii]|uniref:Uncharacterized protein n=1 Tax=Dendrolimus kikuchii TaxID=765133 RepID=A0ACC1DFU5_9NEOP|nr:hypothetical protein K1T71_000845 [Dendrolimus kikuchii]